MKFPLTIPAGRRFDVIGFGTNAVDFLISVPDFPAFGGKIELNDYTRAAGGEIASTVAGLQRVGMRTAYAGSFGGDDAGEFGMGSLGSEGVDISFSKRVADASTQIAFILIDERTGERTVIWKRDPRLAFEIDAALIDAVADSSVLHMSPHDTAACVRLARAARAAGTIVSVDIDNEFEGIDELMPLVDILIASSEFPSRFIGEGDPKLALRELHTRYGSALTGMTLGSHGSLLCCGGEYFETAGFDVPGGCEDTTGAGDAFRVGLLYGLSKGETIADAARMANAVAALKCREIGARTALPDESELQAFLKKS